MFLWEAQNFAKRKGIAEAKIQDLEWGALQLAAKKLRK